MSILFNESQPDENTKFFIGIDQSMTHTGLTIISEDNIVFSKGFSSSTELTFEERISSIRSFIMNTLMDYDNNAIFISIEGLAFNRRPSNNSMMLFGLFTTIITELTTNGYKYKIVAPTSLKKSATGRGDSDKEKMLECIPFENIELLKSLSGVKNKKKFEDIVDSYWLSMYSLGLLNRA